MRRPWHSPDEETLFLWGNGRLTFLKRKDLSEVCSITTNAPQEARIACSPKGDMFCVGGSSIDGIVFDAKSGKEIRA
jgi:hypothetical protein